MCRNTRTLKIQLLFIIEIIYVGLEYILAQWMPLIFQRPVFMASSLLLLTFEKFLLVPPQLSQPFNEAGNRNILYLKIVDQIAYHTPHKITLASSKNSRSRSGLLNRTLHLFLFCLIFKDFSALLKHELFIFGLIWKSSKIIQYVLWPTKPTCIITLLLIPLAGLFLQKSILLACWRRRK